ncbi:MAG: hypothetical protein M3299_06235 [Thermoproteota archaeon]|nr:hypothetical protein [Thermoproteota archaeon]
MDEHCWQSQVNASGDWHIRKFDIFESNYYNNINHSWENNGQHHDDDNMQGHAKAETGYFTGE